MSTVIPSSQDIRDALRGLTMKQIELLAERSGVPATTIYKIKRGETDNPGIETVGKFLPHVREVITAATPTPQLSAAGQGA